MKERIDPSIYLYYRSYKGKYFICVVAELAGAEVIKFDRNYGKAYALMRGFERTKELNCFAVVTLDGENN